jgi:two-component system nitrogen regulation sensor histidine kinase GlnL
MRDGGRLTVTSRVMSEYHMTQDGGRARLVAVDILDTGPGIPLENIDKVGTPFFTTKDTGTGLGLAICQKIIAEHRGMMKIDAPEGQGTKITVMLPLIQTNTKGY